MRLLLPILVLMLGPHAVQAQSMQISGLNDLTLGTWSGSGDLFSEDPLCVYFLGIEPYQITASGSGVGGAFTLTGTGGSVAYQVQFKGSTGAYDTMTSGSARSFGDADISSQNCGGLSNAHVKVLVTEAALSSALSGSYSGTVTLLLEPD